MTVVRVYLDCPGCGGRNHALLEATEDEGYLTCSSCDYAEQLRPTLAPPRALL